MNHSPEPALLADELAAEPFDAVTWFSKSPVISIPDEVVVAVESGFAYAADTYALACEELRINRITDSK